MNKKKNIVSNAIIWAAVILSSSLLMKGLEGDIKFMLLLIHIVGWLTVDQTIRKNSS